jgi:hypothetical protein
MSGRMTDCPLVSYVVPCFNYERYMRRSLDSIVGQDWPADALEVIVVDDGSTDATPEVARSYGEPVHYVRKDNGGVVSAVNRGVEEARGEFIAIASPDDVCLPHRTRRQVDLLRARPEVGLVYGDMELIDEEDRLTHGSYFQATGTVPMRGRVLGHLMKGNFVTGGAIMVRASLKPAFHPIGDVAIWEDWWIAAKVAEVAELDYLEEPIYRYRQHGENINFGLGGDALTDLLCREIPFRRYLIATVKPLSVPTQDLLGAHVLFEGHVATAAARAGVAPWELVDVTDADLRDAALATAAAEADLGEGEVDGAAARLVAALALDPWSRRARRLLEGVVTELPASPLARATAPQADTERLDGLAEMRSFAVLADADELLERPDLLAAYLGAFTGADDATLVIYGPDREPEEMAARLGPLAEEVGANGGDSADLLALALPSRADVEHALTSRAWALLSERPAVGPFAELPRYGVDSLEGLRELADARAPR